MAVDRGRAELPANVGRFQRRGGRRNPRVERQVRQAGANDALNEDRIMASRLGLRWGAATLAAAGAIAFASAGFGTEPNEPPKAEGRAGPAAASGAPLPPAVAVPAGEYWLGLLCRPTDDPSRAESGIEGESALRIEQVVPDSPAERAGIQPGDVLLQLDGKPMKRPEELQAAVQRSGGKRIELHVRRGDRELTIATTPEKRPAFFGALPADLPDAERMRKLFEQLGADQAARARQAMRWHSLGPGLIVRVEPPGPAVLPDNMTIAVQKSGRQPAEIVVTCQGQTYRVREDQIDRLPESIRPHVETVLGRTRAAPLPAQRSAPAGSAALPSVAIPRIDLFPTAEPSLEARVEELTRRVEALTRTVEQLQRQIDARDGAAPREQLPAAPPPAEKNEP